MPRHNEFVDFVIEQMAPILAPRVRAMFGGFGIYQDDVMFAIVTDDRLYFKANAETRGEFEARGLSPFSYVARGRVVNLQYFEAPPEVFEDTDAMREWLDKAIAPRRRSTPRETEGGSLMSHLRHVSP